MAINLAGDDRVESRLDARRGIRGIADVPRVYAAIDPDHPALIFEGRTTSYGALERRTSQAANGVLAAGLRANSRFAWLGKNSDIFFELMIAGAKSGTVLVPVNWRLALEEILYIISDSDTELLFIGPDYAAFVPELRRRVPKLRLIVSIEQGFDDVPGYEEWMAPHGDHDLALPVNPDDDVLQLYTSGTTGHPKGAQLTNRCILAQMQNADTGELGDWDEHTHNLVCLPVFHVAGGVWGAYTLYAGGTAVVLREANPVLILAALANLPITKAGMVPAVLKLVLDHPDCAGANFGALQTIYYGASPITPELMRRSVETFGCGFVQMFGMTEVTGSATFLSPADHDLANPQRILSCGRPFSTMSLRIVSPNGEALGPNQAGEVLLKGDTVMKGYWKRPEATAEAVKDGWYHTGDIGELDEQGYLFIRDRIKDMIISGGENVYSSEVENALASHPGVSEVAVIGMPDEKWGETVKAVVVRKPGSTITAEELIAYARSKIAHYKCPRSVDFTAALPRNAAGKVLKRSLREPYLAVR